MLHLRGVSFISDALLLVLIIVGTVLYGKANSQPAPTPCFPASIVIEFNGNLLQETYEPGETIIFEVLPATVDDWPTSPTFRWWDSMGSPGFYDGSNPTSYTIPLENPPPTVRVAVNARGPGEGDCPSWSSPSIYYDMRRFDVTPTPTPTPLPTPSPTPVCTYTPDETCRSRLIIEPPPYNETHISDTFEFEIVPPAVYLGTETFGGSVVFAEQISENRWRFADLPPGGYLLYYRCDVIPCMDDFPYVWAQILRVHAAQDVWVVTGNDKTTKSAVLERLDISGSGSSFPIHRGALGEYIRGRANDSEPIGPAEDRKPSEVRK